MSFGVVSFSNFCFSNGRGQNTGIITLHFLTRPGAARAVQFVASCFCLLSRARLTATLLAKLGTFRLGFNPAVIKLSYRLFCEMGSNWFFFSFSLHRANFHIRNDPGTAAVNTVQ